MQGSSGESLNLAVFCFVISHKLCGDDNKSVSCKSFFVSSTLTLTPNP